LAFFSSFLPKPPGARSKHINGVGPRNWLSFAKPGSRAPALRHRKRGGKKGAAAAAGDLSGGGHGSLDPIPSHRSTLAALRPPELLACSRTLVWPALNGSQSKPSARLARPDDDPGAVRV